MVFTQLLGNIENQMRSKEFIEKIEYNKEWFDYEFLPDSFIELQIKTWLESEDHNIEHYKWAGYRHIMENEDLSDFNRLKEFVTLINNDPNEHLYKGAIADLIRGKIIDDKVFNRLGQTRFSDDPKMLNKLTDIT